MIKSNKKYLAVSTTYREDPWNLMEWIEYHILVGINHFYIYNNDPNPKTAGKILSPYIESGHVTLINSFKLFKKDRNKQRVCHNDALRLSKNNYRWLALLDSDEFLYPVSCNNVCSVLGKYENLPAVAFNYLCFGSNGLQTRPEMQIESYLKRSKDNWEWNRLTKSIGQTHLVHRCDHHHKFSGPLYDEDKNRCKWVKDFKGNHLRIIHYMARSKEDFEVKMKRGNPLGEKRDWKWFKWADRNEMIDEGINNRFGALVREKLEEKISLWKRSKLQLKIM